MRFRTLAALLSAFAIACGSDDASDAPPADPTTPISDPQTNPAPSTPSPEDMRVSDAGTEGGSSTVTGPGAAPSERFTGTIPANGFFRVEHGASTYWVRLPKGYDVARPTAAPMFVALHGCGDTAENFVQWGAAPYELRANQSYIAVAMELGRNGACWNIGSDGPTVMNAIADVRKYFFADQRKIHVAGYSSGGILAYKLGLANANFFASIAIEHSAAEDLTNSIARANRKIPIAHNAAVNDGSFGIATARQQMAAFRAAGFPVTYSEDPGDHNGDSAHFVKLIGAALPQSL